MSQLPIDPSSALKRLFERRRSSGGKSPEALFRPAPAQEGGASPPPPAGAGRGIDMRRLIGAGRQVVAGVGALVRRLAAGSSGRDEVSGVDIGHTAIKVVRLRPEHDTYRLAAAHIEELIAGAPMEDLAREVLVKEKLRGLKAKGLLNGPVVLSFHHRDSIVESVRLPKMPAEELQQAVTWEAQERLSLKPDRTIIRYIVNGEVTADGQQQLEILLLGVPREPLMAGWRALAEMGVKVAAVEPVSLAGFYPLTRLNLWKPNEVVGCLEIGARTSHLCFVHGNAVRFSRSFQVAGDSVTQAIADYCQKEFAEAERLKWEFGISKMALEEDRHEVGHEAEDRVRVSHALGLHLEQLVAEIEHSYRYFAFELGGSEAEKMDRLLLTGGGGLLKYLPEFLAGRLSIPVEVADPLQGIPLDREAGSSLQPGWSQRLTVAMGLAMRPVIAGAKGKE